MVNTVKEDYGLSISISKTKAVATPKEAKDSGFWSEGKDLRELKRLYIWASLASIVHVNGKFKD